MNALVYRPEITCTDCKLAEMAEKVQRRRRLLLTRNPLAVFFHSIKMGLCKPARQFLGRWARGRRRMT